jgi:hexosaminidase
VAGAALGTTGVAPAAPATAPGSASATPSGTTAATAPGAGPRPLGQVVPAPASVEPHGQPFTLAPSTVVSVPGGSAGAVAVGEYLARLLRPSTGYPVPVTRLPLPGGITLRLGKGDGLGAEGYRLDAGRSGVVIRADAPAGLFHGVQTLRQLLPAAVESRTRVAGPWQVAGGTITDTPRYAYRGAMLDVSRHFFTVAQVERYIDELALYKIDYLHLHLSDDQGWRIAVPSWPRLAAYGGSTEVGGGPGGYYTEAQYERIVRYARSRFITIVPEIDMPAHTNAALASYAQLNCDGVAPPLYTGTNVGFSSLCVDKDVTYTFVKDVIRELAALTPGPYLHIGGDEAHSTTAADYRTFMDRVQPFVGEYGKTVMAWNEITDADPVKGAIAQYWGTAGDETSVIDAAKAGTRLVMSPANHAYLDMKYDKDTPLGLSWAGYTEVEDAYGWDPATFLKGAPASAVYGVEAPLWSETLVTSANIEYMAFPRLPAIAELGWSPAATHDWDAFSVRLAAQGPRWDVMGVDYYHSPQVPWPAA